jgi:hydroxyacylglutathione hydrolase
MRLARVGIENVLGYLDDGMLAWERAGFLLAQVPQISVLDLYQQLCDLPDDVQLLDVRRPAEWEAGHIAQAVLKPLNTLRSLLADLDRHRAIAVHCKSGYRSSIAASLLKRAGFHPVMNVVGGFDAWLADNLPVSNRARAV